MKKEKYSGLDGRTYVRWTEENSTEPRAFIIEASPSGIRLKGTMSSEIETMEELQEFAKLISDCQLEHIKLRKEVGSKLILSDAQGNVRQNV